MGTENSNWEWYLKVWDIHQPTAVIKGHKQNLVTEAGQITGSPNWQLSLWYEPVISPTVDDYESGINIIYTYGRKSGSWNWYEMRSPTTLSKQSYAM